MHGIVRLTQDFVDVLVRHLVLEHLHQHAPTVIEQQTACDFDDPQAAVPAAQTRPRIDELERRTLELKTEQGAIQIFPGTDNGVQRCTLEFGAESVGTGFHRRTRSVSCEVLFASIAPMSRNEDALRYHREGRPGKIEVVWTKPVASQLDLSLAYSPGVAAPCLEIAKDPDAVDLYTARRNLVGVVTNGTAVLGLGNIGPRAAKPVMEGKAVLFKRFADIDVFDIEVDEIDPEKFITIVRALEPTFGAINLEDIRAPDCFVIERALRKQMKIPVFHDDQHGPRSSRPRRCATPQSSRTSRWIRCASPASVPEQRLPVAWRCGSAWACGASTSRSSTWAAFCIKIAEISTNSGPRSRARRATVDAH